MRTENRSNKSTQELVEETIAGNTEAFAHLVERYRDAASAVAYSYLGRFDDVQDAVQESFIQAYYSLRQLREPARFGPWLRKITANSCAMILRKHKRSNVSLDEVTEQPSVSDDTRGIAAREVVSEALSKLSDATRLTVTLSYIDGYSHAEVAEFLEVPLTTVRSRLRHAKRKLREEMIEMVSDVLHQDKPGEELVRTVVENFVRWHKAVMVEANQEALRHCNEALAAIKDLTASTSPDQLREMLIQVVESGAGRPGDKIQTLHNLKTWSMEQIKLREEVDILMRKGEALLHMDNVDGAQELFDQALELARGIDSKDALPVLTEKIAHNYHNLYKSEPAREYLQQVLEMARNAGDTFKEAMNLWAIANMYMTDNQPLSARPLYEQAHTLFTKAGQPARAAMSRASVDLIDEVGESNWPRVIHYSAFCLALRKAEQCIEVTDKGGGWFPKPAEHPWAFHIHVLSGLGKIFDTSLPAGETWQEGDNSWITDGPLKVTHTVLGYDETITTNKAVYSGCMLIETLTLINKLPENMSDELKSRLHANTGSIRRWYAPGIGLVRATAQNNERDKADIQLEDYQIIDPDSDYLPLAPGNSWTYGWINTPQGYSARDCYRIVANEDEYWYLENYRYILR